MNRQIKQLLFFLLGLVGIVSLLCSIAASGVTNSALMKQGFLSYAQTSHLNVPATAYGDYAQALCRYLDGKTDSVQVPDPLDPSRTADAFSEKENLHLRDVRSIVTFLKGMRWAGGGGVAAVIAGLYLFDKKGRPHHIRNVLQGFAWGAMAVLGTAIMLGVWGLIDFQGLFWCFHQLVFPNDLWLLNPETDLLVALMPLPFFTWYAGQLLKSMLPVLGMLLCLVVAWFKVRNEDASADPIKK